MRKKFQKKKEPKQGNKNKSLKIRTESKETKISANKILGAFEILQKPLHVRLFLAIMEGKGGGSPPCQLCVALDMASAFAH